MLYKLEQDNDKISGIEPVEFKDLSSFGKLEKLISIKEPGLRRSTWSLPIQTISSNLRLVRDRQAP